MDDRREDNVAGTKQPSNHLARSPEALLTDSRSLHQFRKVQ